VRPRRPPQQYYIKKPDHIHPADMMILHPNMSRKTPLTVAHGDGVGPEIVTGARYDIVKTESLRNFDGNQGFTLFQGQ
jgi:hypothetical protein